MLCIVRSGSRDIPRAGQMESCREDWVHTKWDKTTSHCLAQTQPKLDSLPAVKSTFFSVEDRRNKTNDNYPSSEKKTSLPTESCSVRVWVFTYNYALAAAWERMTSYFSLILLSLFRRRSGQLRTADQPTRIRSASACILGNQVVMGLLKKERAFYSARVIFHGCIKHGWI